jgi:hypothetical protein
MAPPPALTATTRRPATGAPLEELLDDELLEEELLEDELVDELPDELLELLEEEPGAPLEDCAPHPKKQSDKSTQTAKCARKRGWILSWIIEHRDYGWHCKAQYIQENAEILFR